MNAKAKQVRKPSAGRPAEEEVVDKEAVPPLLPLDIVPRPVLPLWDEDDLPETELESPFEDPDGLALVPELKEAEAMLVYLNANTFEACFSDLDFEYVTALFEAPSSTSAMALVPIVWRPAGGAGTGGGWASPGDVANRPSSRRGEPGPGTKRRLTTYPSSRAPSLGS